MPAPAPTRSTFSTTISFGLVNIPVSIYTGSEETRVTRSEYVEAADGAFDEVGRQPYNKRTGEVVEYDSIVKKAQASDGTLVDLTDAEIDAVTVDRPGIASIEALVPLSALGSWLVPTKLYQVRGAGKGAAKAGAEYALGLLLDRLRNRGEGALVKVAMRGGSGARFAVLTPDGDLHVVHYSDAIRERRDLFVGNYSPAEAEAADSLLDSIGTSVPDLSDARSAAVAAYVDAKAAGQVEGEAQATEAPATQVGGLLEALQASIEASKAAQAEGVTA